MPLSTGKELGHYEVLSLLGKGGMGEVYRARDMQLKREVALKVLPAAFSSDPERLARFQREAELLASLDHPNIGHIHGMVQSEQNWALVLALIEGPTLADRLLQGPLPPDEAIAYCKQIIDALEYAHEHGVIHRDLKPANIKITPDGVVKVLDFGLAKALDQRAATSLDPENSPTLTMGATQAGVIMGTAAYMSPEQAVGKGADRRSDIFSFGVVLYEMLTGQRPFRGESMGDTLAAVVKDTPDLSVLPAATPSYLRKLLERMLAKDRKERLQAIGEARIALAKPQIDEAPSRGAGSRPARPWALAAVAAAFALAASALAFIHFREAPPQQQTTRYSITTPEKSDIHSFALSPDGRTLVMAASVSGKRQLYLRPMDALQFQPMAFTDEATFPFWSPDSRFIGFFAQGKLKKVAASGGPSLALCDAPDGYGGSWNRDDVIVFSPTGTGPLLLRVAAAGGVPADVVKSQSGFLRHPVFLPDGRHFLYTIQFGPTEQSGIYVASLDQKAEKRRILPDESGAQFAPPERSGQPGHLLFVRQNTLMSVPFDAASAQVSGEVFPLADSLGVNAISAYAPITVSENGVLLYETVGAAGGGQLAWVDRAGKQLGSVGTPGVLYTPAISPDEKQVVFSRGSGKGQDLWVRDLSRGTETRLTNDASQNIAPSWSPKGDRIAFTSTRRDGAFNLYSKAASGSGQDELLLQNSGGDLSSQWSGDGRFLVYFHGDQKTKQDIWVLPMEGAAADRKPTPFLQSEFGEFLAQLSPDSHWMAYTSDRSGRRDVYVRPFPSGEGEYTISIAGGEQSRWRSDGKELFFVGADGNMMAVPVKTSVGATSAFEAGTPAVLFEANSRLAGSTVLFQYDVSADGKRFLISTTGAATASAPLLTVVTNWQAGVKK